MNLTSSHFAPQTGSRTDLADRAACIPLGEHLLDTLFDGFVRAKEAQDPTLTNQVLETMSVFMNARVTTAQNGFTVIPRCAGVTSTVKSSED